MQRKHLAVAVISATAALGLGGAGIAAAQTDDDSSTTVTTPDTSATDDATTESVDDAATPEGCEGGSGRGLAGALNDDAESSLSA